MASPELSDDEILANAPVEELSPEERVRRKKADIGPVQVTRAGDRDVPLPAQVWPHPPAEAVRSDQPRRLRGAGR